MSETEKNIAEQVINAVQVMFAEASILLLLLGLVLFLVGIAFLLMTIFIRHQAYRVKGKVVGGIKELRVKEKTVNGKTEKESRQSYTAIFEYQRPDGTLHREKASEGGSHVLKYKTGQSVDLLVMPGEKYDDVYDASKKGFFYIAIALIIIGAILMERGASIYASLSIGTVTLVIILLSLAVKALMGRKKKSGKVTQQHYKYFDPDLIQPIEELAAEVEGN